MKISKDKVVTIQYTITDDEGDVLASNEGGKPLSYLHGYGNILQNVEHTLENQEVGFTESIVLEAGQAYGEHQDNAVMKLPRQHFPPTLEPGMQVHLETKSGFTSFTVMAVDTTTVTFDTNHPLAGKRLHFVVEVIDVRSASPHEINQGHVDWH